MKRYPIINKITVDVFEWKTEKLGQDYNTFTFSDGGKYVGEWKDGKMNGQGTDTSADGAVYVGEWKDGKRNGHGTFTTPVKGEVLIGIWKDDEFVG